MSHTFAIRNETANCTKGIDEPADRGVYEQCQKEDFGDPQLQKWEAQVATPGQKPLPRVQKYEKNAYIYCLYSAITINARKYRCPPFPFILDITQPFEVGNVKHNAALKQVSVEDRVLESHYRHLNISIYLDHTFQDQMRLL